MSLLGIDVGTSGCKSAVFSERGELLSVAYEEYDMERPQPGWAQLDAVDVWQKIKGTIRVAVGEARGQGDTIRALAELVDFLRIPAISSLKENAADVAAAAEWTAERLRLSLIHISEPTRPY